jgi:hypothetical protein
MISIRASRHQAEAANVKVDKLPDSCPLCHRGIQAQYHELAHVKDGWRGRLELIFQCPSEGCQSFFISRYFKSTDPSGYYQYFSSLPLERFTGKFSESIKRISPTFCQIAEEAMNAEASGWKLVAGPGYRKALEFLLKDYLCRLHAKEVEAIKATPLAACVKEYVDHEKLKAMAARAAWLGNDETHYVRKWEDKDLEDLKKVIFLTSHWIEMAEMTESVMKDMPEGKK